MTEVEVVTLIRADPATVFDLDLELDADVHAASMTASGETATSSTGRPALGLGDEVTFTARRFVDEQVRGPFRSLRRGLRAAPAPRLPSCCRRAAGQPPEAPRRRR
jgi:hypothetical protein